MRTRRLEAGALVLLVPANDVAAAGRRRPVFLALEIPLDRVLEDLGAAGVADDLNAPAHTVVVGTQVGLVGVVLDVSIDLAVQYRGAAALMLPPIRDDCFTTTLRWFSAWMLPTTRTPLAVRLALRSTLIVPVT
jgi:hypothetical protein